MLENIQRGKIIAANNSVSWSHMTVT